MKIIHPIKITSILTALCSALALNAAPSAQTEAQKQLDLYRTVASVTASVRKTTDAAETTVRMLSRVHYKKGGFVHIENISPSKRRIIADGKSLYYYDESARRGFSRPISELDEDWSSSLNTVPGSPMEHLLKMAALEEAPAPSSTSGRPAFVYHGGKNHVVMVFDSEKRITSIEFFEDSDLKKPFALFEYSNFVKAGDTWLSSTHTASRRLPDGSKVTEVRQFDNLSVDKDIPAKLFDHKLFMEKVEFVSEFDKTWE